eukprot:Skav216312  [mRNA]  locus=scaffold494:282968:291311:- [translate_table: standard]
MLGRKREDLASKGGAKKRKKWQEESDDEDEPEEATVTAEEMEEWKKKMAEEEKQEERERQKRIQFAKHSAKELINPVQQGDPLPAFMWPNGKNGIVRSELRRRVQRHSRDWTGPLEQELSGVESSPSPARTVPPRVVPVPVATPPAPVMTPLMQALGQMGPGGGF